MRVLLQLMLITSLLSSCSLAPDYQRPPMPVPEHFKETGRWVKAKTLTSPGKPIPWWESFQDPLLTKLEEQAAATNQNLQAAFFRYQQAKALVQVARAGFFPTIQGLGNTDRQKTSSTVANPSTPALYNNILLGMDLSYQLDVFGSIRNTVERNKNLAQASAADVATLTLSIQTELANDYFTLRGYDEQQRILNATVSAYQKALYLTQKRYQGGVAPIEDVDNAQTQVENAKTLAAETKLKRSQVEHAIALLLGTMPSYFSIAAVKEPMHLLHIAPKLPSTLLERRPDIVAAELRVKAANANIGIARAAFFPEFNLSSVIGFQSQSLSNLISKPSLFWSLGPISALTLVQPTTAVTLFDGGKLQGLLKQANASYFETVALYRQTVLTAIQEVEDALIAIKQLDKENHSQTAASQAAQRALVQAQHRYRGGIATFLDVVVIEDTALRAELAQVTIHTRQRIACVQLVKALGGGWAQLFTG